MFSGKRLAVLGAGMMGGALVRGLVRAGTMSPDQIVLFDLHAAKALDIVREIGGDANQVAVHNAREAVVGSDIVVLAVKPSVIPEILSSVSPSLNSNQLVVSIAAGVKISRMEALLAASVPVIRAMPNTPALVGEGATALARGTHATAEHLSLAQHLFASLSRTVIVEEKLMDAVTGLSGSGPAYVYLMIEALMDGGVKAGLTRETARLLAAQTVYGAAKMVLESNDHPAQLKDNVTTPGGTTIQGLAVLERAGFRTAIIDAIEAAAERSRQMS